MFTLTKQPSFAALKFWLEEIKTVSFSNITIAISTTCDC